ncbi:Transcriptional regulator, LysR family [hydrothermal vent metagenome]|uniref:Transcriptional regulator, LysR family n=1 Tax=hydrothermal vent metagenome TaxID=652676 RepID=A0A3B0T6X7_9ZZZZ
MGQLEDMTAFVRIVEAGTLSRAAKQLGVAKSAVSRQLTLLEERLGVQLLQRTTRRSSLTEAGRSYYQRALQILADVGELNAATSKTMAQLTGALKIAVPQTFGLQHLSPLMVNFAKAHPGLVLHLDFSDRQVNLVEEGFDVAIRIAELGDSSLIARRLAPIKIILCASPAYLEHHGTPKNPPDLRRHQTLQYSFGGRSSWKFVGPDGRAVSAGTGLKLSASNGAFLRDAAVSGQGIARLPTFIVWREIENGTLVRVMADYTIAPLNLYAIYPQTRHLSTRVRALIDFLVKRFDGVPYWDRSLQ